MESKSLIKAVQTNNINKVNELLQQGIDPNMRSKRKYNDSEENSYIKKGDPLLIIATRNNNVDMVRLLLQYGADPDIVDEYHRTALSWAAFEYVEILEILLKFKKRSSGRISYANPNISDYDGVTPLMHAAFAEGNETVKLLLEHGAKVNQKNIQGHTALSYAYSSGNEESIKLLLIYGANPVFVLLEDIDNDMLDEMIEQTKMLREIHDDLKIKVKNLRLYKYFNSINKRPLPEDVLNKIKKYVAFGKSAMPIKFSRKSKIKKVKSKKSNSRNKKVKKSM